MRPLSSLRIASAAAAALLVLGATVEAAPIVLNNADFSDGLAGWTTFTKTVHGTLGLPPLPGVESFDVDGDGVSSLAAKFDVGIGGLSIAADGGGIYQTFVSGAGTLSLSADVAGFHDATAENLSAGLFELLLDGVSVDAFDSGPILFGQTLRDTLSAVAAVEAGPHEIRILMTRPFSIAVDGIGVTPFQYIDDVSLDLASVPEPAALALLSVGLVAALARARDARA